MKMNSIKNSITLRTGLALIVMLSLFSCKDEAEEQLNLSRMFRPATFDVTGGEKTAVVKWNASLFTTAGEVEYKLELSKDIDFSTIEISETTDRPERTFRDTDIDIRIDYYARVKAIGKNGVGDSNWLVSNAFRITGEIFILPIREYDVTITEALIRWKIQEVLTKIVVTPQGNPSFDVTITIGEYNAGEKLVGGLTQNTTYKAEVFNGENVSKGSVVFKTKPSYSNSTIIDLTTILDRPNVLADTLGLIPSGSVVLLKRGHEYVIPSSKDLDRSVTITSGPDFIEDLASVFMSSNFNLVASSVIDSIVFKDLNMYSDNYDGKYIFNINRIGTIGTVRFENIKGHKFRGFFRMQTGSTGTQVSNFFMNNSIVDSLRDFSLVNCNNQNAVANIRVTNSTIYNARKVIDHRSPGSNSIVFANCTFNNLPTGGAAGGGSFYFIDLNTENTTNGITITNCIFGKSRDEAMGGDDVRGIRKGGTTNVTVTNSYSTSDYISTNETYQIPLLTFPSPSTNLFANPAQGNFTIVNSSFPGADNTGDPRWRQ